MARLKTYLKGKAQSSVTEEEPMGSGKQGLCNMSVVDLEAENPISHFSAPVKEPIVIRLQ